MIEIIDSKPKIEKKKKKPIMALIFISIFILGVGYFFISDGIFEKSFGTLEQHTILKPDINPDEILIVNDINGEITSYPAVTTISYSKTDGWMPTEQYFTFENKRNNAVDDVNLAVRFSEELQKGELYELKSIKKKMVNGSYEDEYGINISTHYDYYKDEWVKLPTPEHIEINNKHIYYGIVNFDANEIKKFKVRYLPQIPEDINDFEGKWDVVAFIGNPNNPDYSLILDPSYTFSFGDGGSWLGIFNKTREDETNNLTIVYADGSASPFNSSGFFESHGIGKGIPTQWNLTLYMPHNYSVAIHNNTENDLTIHYEIHMNETGTIALTDNVSYVSWNAITTPTHNTTDCVIGNCITMDVNTEYWQRANANDNSLENTDISFETWFKMEKPGGIVTPASDCGAGGECVIWSYSTSTTDRTNYYSVFIDADGNPKCQVKNGASTQGASADEFVNDREWHHLYCQWGSGTNDMYLDGDLVVNGSSTVVIPSDAYTQNEIGNWGNSQKGWLGSIDETILRIGYLTAEEIQNHFEKGTGKVKIQTAYSDDNLTWTGFKNFTGIQNNLNISGNSGYVKFWAYLETINSSITPFIESISFNNIIEDITGGEGLYSNQIRLNSTEGTNYTNEELYVSFIPISNKTVSPLYANISFWNHSIFHSEYLNVQLTNNTYYQFDFMSINTTNGDIWFAEINLSDVDATNLTRTINLTIRNKPPSTPNINFPENNTLTSNYTINLSCYGSTNIDGGGINYEFYGDLNTNPPTTLISNTTSQNISYTLAGDGDYWWRCRANDNSSVSDYNDTRSFILDRRLLLFNTSFYNNPVAEGSLQYFQFNLSFNPILVSSTNVYLTYNNTIYSTTKTNITVNFTKFDTSLVTPLVDSANDISFTWNVTINLLNGTTNYNNSFTQAQTITTVNLSYCVGNEPNMVVVLNYTFMDEDNNTIIEGNATSLLLAEANYIIYQQDLSSNKTLLLGRITNKTNFKVCMSPPDLSLTVDGQIKYEGSGYNSRDYYYRNYTVDNITDNIGLYLLDSTRASAITFVVTDPDDVEIENAIITIKRYDVGNNTLRTIAMGKTNFDGKDLIYLRKNDVFYSIFITQEDGTVTIFPNQKIINTNDELNIKITSGTLAEIINAFNNAKKDITISGKTFKAYYNDSSGLVQEGCFSIQKISAINGSMVYYNCIQGSEGSWVYTVDNQSAVFDGSITLKINPKTLTINKIVDFTVKVLYNILGSKTSIFIAIMISLALLGFGLVSPAFAVIISLFTTIFFFMLGLTPMGIGTLISFIIIGALLLKKLNE